MEKLRGLIQGHRRWSGLEIYPQRIDTFIGSDFINAVENGKALLESICKTILDEQKETYGATENINRLYSTLVG